MLGKNPHTCTYNKGDILAVTISPDDKHQWATHTKRYEMFVQYFEPILDKLLSGFNHYFTIELSEPIGDTIKTYPRLHLHGIIHLSKPIHVFKFLLTILPTINETSLYSIKHIKTIDSYNGWIDYINCQQQYMPTKVITNYVEPTQFHDNAKAIIEEHSTRKGDNGGVQAP